MKYLRIVPILLFAAAAAHARPRADFNVKPACVRTPVPIANTSTGATSSSWSFPGGSPPSSTATTPNVSYSAPGTYSITLCINGGTTTPLCITKTVTINAAPAIPTITGPTTACQNPGTYCVASQPGVTFSWALNPPTAGTITPTSPTCVKVTWNNTGGIRVLTVTATNQAGCTSRAGIEVTPCPVHPCCPEVPFRVGPVTLTKVGTQWQFRPVISAPSARRVVIDIISAGTVSTSTGTGCVNVPAFAPVITSVTPVVAGLAGSLPVPNATEAVWSGTATALSNVAFPVNVHLPPLPAHCSDVVKLCVKYTVTDEDCRTCERIECYEFRRPAIIDPTGGTSTATG